MGERLSVPAETDFKSRDRRGAYRQVQRWRSAYGVPYDGDRGRFLTDPILADYIEDTKDEARRILDTARPGQVT